MALIFYKTNNLYGLLPALIGACLTRIEGLSIVGTIGFCYLLRLKFLGIFVTSLSLLTPLGILCLHKWKFGTYWAYFNFNMRGMNLIKFPPFHAFLQLGKAKTLAKEASAIVYLLIIFFVGLVGLANVSFPLTVFCSVYFFYCSVLDHIDIWRYALPGYSIALLIGFDCIWSHSLFKDNAAWLAPCYAILVAPYVFINLATNRASDDFVKEVMSGPIASE
jgi:hypothetical protein